jgi:Ankyrin repeats (3 copies)
MSASLKQRITPDPAAAELWRVAETGEVAELARILPRVSNVNARNKNGMTALMRAAYHGHERMVLALLEHGADPNLMRNDKFTALALAAFFGHTGTVRILIEHGAKTEVVTRCGASAQMWANARTFDKVARCIETHTTPRQRAVVKTLKDPPEIWELVQPAPRSPLVVKTLKEPPEIWDLVQVQEVPKSFNARSAFVSRFKSINGSFAIGVAAALLIGIACAVGLFVLRGSRSVPVEVPSNPTETKVVAAESVANPSSEPSASTAEPEISDVPVTDAVRNHGARKVQPLPRQTRSRPVVEDVVKNAPSREAPAAPPVVATPPPGQTESRSSSNKPNSKPNSSLSPQLITPAKSSAPKAKVIQWP